MNQGLTDKQWIQQEELLAKANKTQLKILVDMVWKKLDVYNAQDFEKRKLEKQK